MNKKDIFNKYKWDKNTNAKANAMATVFAKYAGGNDMYVEMHNKSVKLAIDKAYEVGMREKLVGTKIPIKIIEVAQRQRAQVIFKEIEDMLSFLVNDDGYLDFREDEPVTLEDFINLKEYKSLKKKYLS